MWNCLSQVLSFCEHTEHKQPKKYFSRSENSEWKNFFSVFFILNIHVGSFRSNAITTMCSILHALFYEVGFASIFCQRLSIVVVVPLVCCWMDLSLSLWLCALWINKHETCFSDNVDSLFFFIFLLLLFK